MTTATNTKSSNDKSPRSGAAKRWFITVLVCILVIVGLAFYKVKKIQAAIAFANSFPEPSESIEAFPVVLESYTPRIKITGEVIAPQRLELHNEISGTISKVGFSSGEAVEAGQTLLQLDDREEQARKKALLARRTLAQREFDRNQKLLAQGRVSEKAVDETRAELDMVKAELEQLQVTINKKRLTAPFAASTGIHQFEVGQLLPMDTRVTTLIGITETLWLDFELPQRASDVHIGDEVRIVREGEEPVNATVIARASELSGATRSLKYRAAFTAKNSGLIPQSFVSIEVPAGKNRDLPVIPDTALRVDQLGDFVYLLKPDEDANSEATSEPALRAYRQSVTVQARKLNKVVISSGVKQGDLVAAKGAFKLREKLRVNVVPSAVELGSNAGAEQ